jgi:two-component system LytT family response regulator
MVMKAFLVDDESLALKRLERMLAVTGRVEIAGTSTDPVEAIEAVLKTKPDVLFLDIEMPGMTGFQMLSKLDAQQQPLIVFTTAYDQYALEAFGVDSVDYLLKPIEASQLARALDKVDRMRRGIEARPDVLQLLERITALAAVGGAQATYPDRIASRTGERVEFIELARVTHFFARDKLTYAATAEKKHVVDHTIQELEQKLDPRKFVRIHRAILLNLDYVHELHTWFAGRMMVRLKDEKHTELTVSRDRVRALKERLGV